MTPQMMMMLLWSQETVFGFEQVTFRGLTFQGYGKKLVTGPVTVKGEEFRIVAYPERRKDRLCAYLEYLGTGDAPAYFSLRLKGRGETLRTYPNNGGALQGGSDSWACGLTFCNRRYSGARGRARDWGACAWPKVNEELSVSGFVRIFEPCDDKLGCGSVIVPIATSPEGRSSLKSQGLREGEEYRMMAVDDGNGFYFDDQKTSLTVRPAYHNRGTGWPRRVQTLDGVEWLPKTNPRTWGPRFLNEGPAALSAWILASVAPLFFVLLLKTFVGVYVIPSESMAPTLRSGDVLVVENFGVKPKVRVGDVVLFKPPPKLAALLDDADKSKTFVKRVAFQQGDRVPTGNPKGDTRGVPGAWLDTNIRKSSYYSYLPPAFCDTIQPDLQRAIAKHLQEEQLEEAAVASSSSSKKLVASSSKKTIPHVVPRDKLFVLGDCAGVSIDSRVWGDLPSSNLVGTPTFRLWPPNRVGPINSLGELI